MPCHGRRFHHHHPRFHRFHPYFPPHHHPFFYAQAMVDDEQEPSFLDNKNKARVRETQDRYVVQMEIPGVKVQHVTIEETKGEIEITAIRMNDTAEDVAIASTPTKTKTLGLLTFDLDDTLYPIQPVINEANAAFARAMESFGFPNIQPEDIDKTCRDIREQVSQSIC